LEWSGSGHSPFSLREFAGFGRGGVAWSVVSGGCLDWDVSGIRGGEERLGEGREEDG